MKKKLTVCLNFVASRIPAGWNRVSLLFMKEERVPSFEAKVNSKKAQEVSVYGSVSAWSRSCWSLCCRSVFLCVGRRPCACVIQRSAQVVLRCACVSPGRALQGSTAGFGCFVSGSPDSEERIVWHVLRPWRWLLPPRPQRSQQTSRAVS